MNRDPEADLSADWDDDEFAAALTGDGAEPCGSASTMLPRIIMPPAGTPAGVGPADLAGKISQAGPVRVTCIDYSEAEHASREMTTSVGLCGFLAEHRPVWSQVRWIDVCGLTNAEAVRALAEKYELHPLAVEDVFNAQRPKCEDYPAAGDHPQRLFIIATTVRKCEDDYRQEQVSLFLGRNTLLTFQQGPEDLFGVVRTRLGGGAPLRRADVSFLMYTLLDVLVDHLFPVLNRISERLEHVESRVLHGSTRKKVIHEVYLMRQRLMLLRRATWPMREMIHQLHRDPHECLSDQTRTYLRDVHDHLLQVVDLTETYREFASGLAENYMSAIAQRTNEVMKVLAVISTIFVPLTFLAGVYGMNLDIPEAKYPATYPLFWLVSILLTMTMLYLFRRRGWL